MTEYVAEVKYVVTKLQRFDTDHYTHVSANSDDLTPEMMVQADLSDYNDGAVPLEEFLGELDTLSKVTIASVRLIDPLPSD